jgi:Domain of unknown function (DUF4855)
MLITAISNAIAAETNSAYFPLYQTNRPNITDLALIYCGNSNRLAWTPDQFQPYVSYRAPKNGAEEWLFDGFLFLEFKDGQGAEFEEGWKQKPARKEEWQWLLNRFFEPGHAIPALEQTCAETEQRIGKPLRPRQVVITLPEPNHTQTNWGAVDGKNLVFTNSADRVVACRWYIQTALEKWHQLAPKHLQLAGFYWLAESAPKARNVILPELGNHIRSHGQRFFWIPYWHSAGSGDWKQLGFDVAYQQPNYFFHPELPGSRLQEACDFGRQHGMGMEMELDGRLATDPEKFASRFPAYLDAFERNGVKTSAAMAYYEGGGILVRFSKSENADHRQHYDRLARWVLDRQHLADRKLKDAPSKPWKPSGF